MNEIISNATPLIAFARIKQLPLMQLLLPVLDPGEAAVIALALERQAKLVLIDELTGRKVAKSLGLSVIGSVGLLIQAKRIGKIEAVEPFLGAMQQAGL